MDKKLPTAIFLALTSGIAFADSTSTTSSSIDTSTSANSQTSLSFDNLDTNKDGSLSQAEYNAGLSANTSNRVQGAATSEDPNDPMVRTPLEKRGIQTTPERPTSVAPPGDLPDKVMDQSDPIMLQGGESDTGMMGGSSASDAATADPAGGRDNSTPSASDVTP